MDSPALDELPNRSSAEEMNAEKARKETKVSSREEPSSEVAVHASKQKFTLSIVIVIGIAVSATAAQQFAKETYSPGFNAPFFLTWFSTSWLLLCFPVTAVFTIISRRRQYMLSEHPVNVNRGSNPIFVFGGAGGTAIRRGLLLGSLFTALFLGANYMYVRALATTAPADAAVIFVSNKVMIYILSCFLLKASIISFKLFALFGSIAGVVMFSYADGFQGAHLAGILLILGSALCSSLYVVLFKRLVNPKTYAEVGLFLSVIGFLDLLICWVFIFAASSWLKEEFTWANIPWGFVCGCAALQLIFNFLMNFGVAVTYPLFIALSTLLSIPLNALVDTVWRHTNFDTSKWVGTLLLVVSFLLILLLPDKHDEVLKKMVRAGLQRDHNRATGQGPAPTDITSEEEQASDIILRRRDSASSGGGRYSATDNVCNEPAINAL